MSVLLESKVVLPNKSLWFGRAELYERRVRIAGWTWTGPYEESISLDRVERVETWSRIQGPNLVLHVNGDAHPLHLKSGIMLWHWKLKELGVEVTGRA